MGVQQRVHRLQRDLGRALATLLLLSSAGPLLSCTDVRLVAVAPVVAISGTTCTDSSNLFTIPVRILVVVDTSESMKLNDPAQNGEPSTGPGFRSVAAANLVSELSGDELDVQFGFIEFNTGANDVTDGFTADPAAIAGVLSELDKREGFTNYLDALGHADDMIRADALKVRDEMIAAEEAGESSRYLKPWYFVVFFSDGFPVMEYEEQTSDEILAKVDALLSHPPDEALGITLHTAYLGREDEPLLSRQKAQDLLRGMADQGNGTFTSYSDGSEIDFSIFDFQIKRLYDIQTIVAFNRNSIVRDQTILADSDGDGISDRDERIVGTDPTVRDSDADGLGDGFEVLSALDPTVVDYVCDADAAIDTDSDGLNDCEEKLRSFDHTMYDTDIDALPDGLEFFSGTNPRDGTDLGKDLDFDGATAGQELLMRTSPKTADGDIHGVYGYGYQFAPLPLDADDYRRTGRACYRFTIDNVSLTHTLPALGRTAGTNDFVIQLAQSPLDDAEQIFALYELVVPLNYFDFGHHDTNLEIHDDVEFELVSTQEVSDQ